MATDLAILEGQLTPLAPHFAQVLPAGMTPDQIIRTVIVSVERLPKLLACDRQSLFAAAMSAAILGLEVDGVTGQAYLIPFKGKAQLLVGYKGYITIAARSGITISGTVVREGDRFDYELGSQGFVRHVPMLNNKGRIIAAWAVAAHATRPPVSVVMGIDDLLAIKARSPAVKADKETPWNDPAIGFPAMCEKTVKRRLSRSLPLNMLQLAARLDEAVEEQGKPAWIEPRRGVVIDGEAQPLQIMQPSETPSADDLTELPPGDTAGAPAVPSPKAQSPAAGATFDRVPGWDDYVDRWSYVLDEADTAHGDARVGYAKQLHELWNGQKALRNKITWPDDDGAAFAKLKSRVEATIKALKKQ